jgi:hypothetical protein
VLMGWVRWVYFDPFNSLWIDPLQKLLNIVFELLRVDLFRILLNYRT